MLKILNKKSFIIILIIVLIILIGGFSYYRENNQKEIKTLNEGLPEGIAVIKTITNEYKIRNEVDGYEFKIPKEWKGIDEIFYTSERTEKNYTTATIELAGKEGSSIVLIINKFKRDDKELLEWAEDNFNVFDLVGNLSEDNINGTRIVKTTEDIHLLGMWVYFFEKDESVYAITNGSENYIEYIIANGKW
jgi:hypothetical protein